MMVSQKINTKVVPLCLQRYETLGDYYDKDGEVHFVITDTGNPLYNKMILIHELIEQSLTEAEGIKEEDILAFDLWVEHEVEEGRYPEDAEPGEHPNSPYKKQHMLAEIVERLMCNHLGIDFNDYSDFVMKVFKTQ